MGVEVSRLVSNNSINQVGTVLTGGEMVDFKLKRGLDLPIEGRPEQVICEGRSVGTVAVVAADFIGLKPRMSVEEGDAVQCGSPLFTHKDAPGLLFTSPAGGRVRSINRGARRVLESIVIEVDENDDSHVDFGAVSPATIRELDRDAIVQRLCVNGLWAAFRTRPYSKVPVPGMVPTAIYVTAMESEPLAPDAGLIIGESVAEFEAGLSAIAKLSDGKTYLCKAADHDFTVPSDASVEIHGFSGPHPAGLAGTHMHFLEPPSANSLVWSIGYQDVVSIGRTFLTGRLDTTRVISVAGPRAKQPRLLRTRMGASLVELMEGETEGDLPVRIISGSVLSGRHAAGTFAYLGRYVRQVTVITEDMEQTVLGWITPQPTKFSVLPVLASAFRAGRLFDLTSNLNGGRRAMVPTGVFETLMPQDFLPTQLLRALLVKDTDTAQALGALELDEEDLALCTFACPAKYEYGQALRSSLQKIETEG